MAAPTTEQVGIDFLIKADSTLIGGATNATYSRTTSMVNVTNKDSGRHAENLPTTQEATIDFDAGFLETSQQTGQALTVEVSSDGGSTFEEVENVTNASLDLSMSLIDRTDADSSRWRELLPGERSATASVDIHYVDPESHAAFDTILSAQDNGNTITVKITLGAFEYEADFHVADHGLDSAVNDAAGTTISLTQSDTDPTLTATSNDDGLQVITDGFYADPSNSFTVLMEVVDTSATAVSGATSREGTFYPESLTIDMPFDGEATVSGTLQNDGAITRTTQT